MAKDIAKLIEYMEGIRDINYSIYIFNNEYVRVNVAAQRGMPLLIERPYSAKGIQCLIQEVKDYLPGRV